MNAVIYDCEIVKCIPPKGGLKKPEFQYCAGWRDYVGMGISVICAYDFLFDSFRVFGESNFDQFRELVDRAEHIIGFNSCAFDDNLCCANGIEIETTYDLLIEVRRATGQPDKFTPGYTRSGYALNDLALASFGYGKSGSGEMAPELWQAGKHSMVFDYCLHDIALTRDLLRLAWTTGITEPHDGYPLRLPTLSALGRKEYQR